MDRCSMFVVSIETTDAYQEAVIAALRLYYSLALGRLDELHSIGAAAIIPAANTTRDVCKGRMTPWSDRMVIEFRDALAHCMEILGHQTEDPYLRLRGAAKGEVSCDVERVLKTEVLLELLGSSPLGLSSDSADFNGASRGPTHDGLESLLLDRAYVELLLHALEVYTRMGFAQLEMLAYYVSDGLIPMKKGSATPSRKAFFLVLERMNAFKALIGYSEKESSPFNGAAVDRSTHLCFELLQELERHVLPIMELGSARSVPREGCADRYTDEIYPRITMFS